MIRLYYLGVMLILSFMLIGCDKKQDNVLVEQNSALDTGKLDVAKQDKVVIEHIMALDAGKLDVAFSFLSKEAQQKFEAGGGSSGLAAGANQLKQHKGIKSIKITGRKVSGQNTILRVAYSLNDGTELFDNIPLINEDGKWKLLL